MKIESSTVAMQSRHYEMRRTEERESLRLWVRPPQPSPAASSAAAETQATDGAEGAASDDYRIQLLKAMLEWLTGKPVELFDASRLRSPAEAAAAAPAPPDAAAPRAGFGVEYEFHASREEVEQTDFAAAGQVTTADGRRIDFGLEVAMARSYSERIDINLRAGEARRKDPLVINPGSSAAQLSAARMKFDLDADGKAEDVPLLAGGSAYLALDLNGNNRVDSGAELFGPATGSGLDELARHDADGNGWIDENDPVFAQLLVWTPEAGGEGTLESLRQRRIGALFLGSIDTSFQLRGAGNEDLGAVRTTGLYLAESGQAGSLQQIDLSV